MTELERLREQRREINRQIAQLTQTPCLSVGRAKLDQGKGNRKEWYVSVLSQGYSTDTYANGIKPRYCRVVTAKDKSEITKLLPDIIRDLQDLYEVMRQDEVSAVKEGDSK